MNIDWNSIVITALICLTGFGVSTQLKSCAEVERKSVVIHYNCEDAPEHKP